MNPVFLTAGTSLFRISRAKMFGAILSRFNRKVGSSSGFSESEVERRSVLLDGAAGGTDA